MPEKHAKKNKLFELVDKAPFAGKTAVQESYLNYVTAPDEKKTRKALTSAAVLGFMVAAHAYQAKLGIDSLSVHAPDAMENSSAKDIIFSGIDGSYALAMGAVTLRQTDLLRKVGQKHYKWLATRKEVPETSRKVEKREIKTKKGAIALAFGVTMAGQVAGATSMIDAMMHEPSESPKLPANELHYANYFSDDMYDTNTVPLVIDHSATRGELPSDDYDNQPQAEHMSTPNNK